MPIQGLTDAATRQAKKEAAKKKPALEIAKGHRQKDGKMGGDLESKLRLTVNYATYVGILKAHYGVPNKEGDFIVDAIKVYLPFDDIDRVCPTTMAAYGKSGFKLQCDRATISKRTKEEKNEQGVFRQIVDVREPCPVKGKPLAQKCPHKCVRQAKLHLYVKEIFDADYLTTAIVDFGGFEDLGDAGILTQLQDWQEELGSLTTSPFYWEIERGDGTAINCNRIPFILSRRKVSQKKPMMEGDKYNPVRTGNNFLGITWILDIQPDPEWMNKYRLWTYKQKQAEELRQSGFQLKPTAIAGLLHSSAPFNPNDVILEAQVLPVFDETPEEPAAEPVAEPVDKPWMPAEKRKEPTPLSPIQREVLKAEFERNDWKPKAVVLMLREKFEVSHGAEMFDYHYNEVYAIASSQEQAKQWNELAEF
jgi:hypothetical protein